MLAAGDSNPELNSPLAKSFGNGFDARMLNGYRHEFGSLTEVARNPDLASLGETASDLALHLIAAHHGRSRPHFESDSGGQPDSGTSESEISEASRRFDRLQRRYGHWGLAWREAVFMAADAAASRECDVERGEDEEDEWSE